MRILLAAAASGILFGGGLSLSHMVDRGRVLGFLDLAGNWDPTLFFVLCGALMVSLITFRIILRCPHPLFDKQFYLPAKQVIDKPLILGAVLFGIGWGVGGYCPGPGFAVLAFGLWNPVVFLVGLFLGARLVDSLRNKLKC